MVPVGCVATQGALELPAMGFRLSDEILVIDLGPDTPGDVIGLARGDYALCGDVATDCKQAHAHIAEPGRIGRELSRLGCLPESGGGGRCGHGSPIGKSGREAEENKSGIFDGCHVHVIFLRQAESHGKKVKGGMVRVLIMSDKDG
jgi:hypothetical protein